MGEEATGRGYSAGLEATNSGYAVTVGLLFIMGALFAFVFLPGYLGPAIALLLFAALTLVYPFGTLCLMMLSIPVHFVLRRSPLQISLPDIVLMGAVIGLVASAYWRAFIGGEKELVRPFRRAYSSPYFWPTLLLLGLATLSMLFLTPHSVAALGSGNTGLKIGLRAYSEIVEPLAVYALVMMTVRDKKHLWLVTDALFLAAVALSFAAIVKAVQLGIHPPPQMRSYFRAESLFNQPNTLALYMSRAIPFFAALALAVPGEVVRRRIYLAGLLAMGITQLLTGSRGGWMAVAVGCVVIAALLGRFRWLIPVGAAGVAGVVVLALRGENRLAGLLNPSTGSGNTRMRLWRAAFEQIRQHPLTGDGLGNVQWMTRYIPASRLRRTELVDAHNLFLDFWTKLGIAGVIAICWLVVVFFLQAWQAFRHGDPVARAFGLGLIAAMAASIVHGMVDAFYFGVPIAVLFWFMLALAESLAANRIE